MLYLIFLFVYPMLTASNICVYKLQFSDHLSLELPGIQWNDSYPESLAARSLEPMAMVWRPKAVFLKMMCKVNARFF